MKKTKLRHLISHWHSVWHHYRHNSDLLSVDRLIIKALRPGHSLVWNSLGFRYQAWVPQLTVYEELLDHTPLIEQQFDNILVLNVFQIRYGTILEHTTALGNLCQHLKSGGRLIFGVNSIFINWNRTAQTLNQTLDILIRTMADDYGLILTHKIVNEFQTDAAKGDCFFIFDKPL
jgi:hypothetical protein